MIAHVKYKIMTINRLLIIMISKKATAEPIFEQKERKAP